MLTMIFMSSKIISRNDLHNSILLIYLELESIQEHILMNLGSLLEIPWKLYHSGLSPFTHSW